MKNIVPIVERITIYPVKSLDGMPVQEAEVVRGGCLKHDREYAIINEQGNFVNGKSNPLVHLLRSTIDPEHETISLRHELETGWNSFHLRLERTALNSYLTEFFGKPVGLHQNKEGRFLDIPDTSGMTVLSSTSLETVAGWFPDIHLEEIRRRFRATIEISGVPAFWEDRLFIEDGVAVKFRIGELTLFGMQPRARCVVPTRHPATGEVIHAFPKTFSRQRLLHLPLGSTLEEYGHGYYLSVDCLIPPSEIGKKISIGDELQIIGRTDL